MPVKISNIDWNSTDALISQQETAINTFLSTRTLTNWAATEEYVLAVFTNVAPSVASKVKVFKLVDSILTNGIAATETAVNNFITGKTIRDILYPERGIIFIIYE